MQETHKSFLIKDLLGDVLSESTKGKFPKNLNIQNELKKKVFFSIFFYI